MSNTTTIGYAPSAGESRLRHLVAGLLQAIGGARERWRQASRLRAYDHAIRGLDRRTRQDLGLYADDGPWPGGGAPLAGHEWSRW